MINWSLGVLMLWGLSTNTVEVNEMTIQKDQLRKLITDTLQEVDLYTPEAVELLMLTAAAESNLGEYIEQVKGPALGIFQMEPATHDDIWANYLKYKKTLSDKVIRFVLPTTLGKNLNLRGNLPYQIIMTRIHYLRDKQPIPKDPQGWAETWKRVYNSHLGKGTVEKALEKYNRYAV
jgi:hypothetical protein